MTRTFPAITHLIQRSQEVAIWLPTDPEAADDLFPPPYVPDGPIADRLMSTLHDEPPIISISGLVAGLILWAFIGIGLGGAIYGALQFALWALSLFGGLA